MYDLTICLVNPQIPPNTGNIARLCAATRTRLHIVGKAGFELTDTHLKRAGLDYWHLVSFDVFEDLESYFSSVNVEQCHFLSSKAKTLYSDVSYSVGDTLVFGSETVGLPLAFYSKYKSRLCTIPMLNQDQGMRSINLATSAGIVLYEAIRQLGSLRS